MQIQTIRFIFFAALILLTPMQNAIAAENTEKTPMCGVDNRACVLKLLRSTAFEIKENRWRDQTLRELAKTYAADGEIDTAISIIPDIDSNDTKAMTIRGIGMEAADLNYTDIQEAEVFQKLRVAANKIEDPPSYAIALTYIAMAQAFAGNNDGAWATAADMENDALRHKAYAETAEIQAENGDFDAAMKSIGFIESEAFRNKAYAIIAKIFADRGLMQQAYDAAMANTNAYKKAQNLQYILDKQNETTKEDKKE